MDFYITKKAFMNVLHFVNKLYGVYFWCYLTYCEYLFSLIYSINRWYVEEVPLKIFKDQVPHKYQFSKCLKRILFMGKASENDSFLHFLLHFLYDFFMAPGILIFSYEFPLPTVVLYISITQNKNLFCFKYERSVRCLSSVYRLGRKWVHYGS